MTGHASAQIDEQPLRRGRGPQNEIPLATSPASADRRGVREGAKIPHPGFVGRAVAVVQPSAAVPMGGAEIDHGVERDPVLLCGQLKRRIRTLLPN
jgi:hypothetical protein